MFEYLMPLLAMRTIEHAAARDLSNVVDRQIEYGEERGVPWGISEALTTCAIFISTTSTDRSEFPDSVEAWTDREPRRRALRDDAARAGRSEGSVRNLRRLRTKGASDRTVSTSRSTTPPSACRKIRSQLISRVHGPSPGDESRRAGERAQRRGVRTTVSRRPVGARRPSCCCRSGYRSECLRPIRARKKF
jgi:hypothetical protein